MNVTTIVLIPGLWMTALCWEHWIKHYSDKGYCVLAAKLARHGRRHRTTSPRSEQLRILGLNEVVDHYEQIIRELETPPIIIGYGFGGLVTQILLDRGWGAAGVAIASAPIKGIIRIPISTLGAFLGDALKDRKASSLTPAQFHRTFANTLTKLESRAAFERYVVPGPNRVLLQAAFANFTPHAATSVNFRNDTRAALLLVAGGKDRIARPSLVKANLNLYRQSTAETDYKEFPSEAHFTLLRETKIADYVLGWALYRSNGSKLPAVSNHTDGWSVQLST